MSRRHGVGGILAAVLTVGCSSPAAPAPAGTGAREAAQGFYDAIVGQDWARAYAALHPDSQASRSAERFSTLAKAYRHNLGFEPDKVTVRTCDEQGRKAIAHVVISGQSSAQARHFKDAVTLRVGPSGWSVVLPPNFGHAPPH
jgi:hypothetical protein